MPRAHVVAIASYAVRNSAGMLDQRMRIVILSGTRRLWLHPIVPPCRILAHAVLKEMVELRDQHWHRQTAAENQ